MRRESPRCLRSTMHLKGLFDQRSSNLASVARQSGQKPNSGNGSSGTSETSDPIEAPPLTLGQKFLVALPELGRNRRGSRPSEVSTSTDKTKSSSKPQSTSALPPARKVADATDHVDDAELADDTAFAEDTEASDDAQSSVDSEFSDETEFSDDTDPVESAGRPTSMGGLFRGAGSQRRSAAAQLDEMKTPELTTLMRSLDDRERRLGLFATPLGAVLAVVLTFITYNHDAVGKGHEATSVIVLDGGISVAFALCVFAAAWFRRRSLTAFALLFLGYSLGLVGIGIPFLFLGGYLLFRAWRIQKVLTSRGVNPRSRSARPRPERGAATRNPTRNPTRNQRSRQDPKTKSSRPVPSKRYTPPKPAPKRPAITKAELAAKPEKSSWFERATRSTPSEPS